MVGTWQMIFKWRIPQGIFSNLFLKLSLIDCPSTGHQVETLCSRLVSPLRRNQHAKGCPGPRDAEIDQMRPAPVDASWQWTLSIVRSVRARSVGEVSPRPAMAAIPRGRAMTDRLRSIEISCACAFQTDAQLIG